MSVTRIEASQKGKWVDFYRVPSHSRMGISYVVAKDRNGDFGCSCPAWTRHTPRQDCKHIREVKQFIGRRMPVQSETLDQLMQTAPAVARTVSRFAFVEVE